MAEQQANELSAWKTQLEEDPEATQEFEEFEGETAITNEKERELFELKDCLKRMDEGTYGICEKCGSPIEESRLKAYPGAIHCSTHAS